MPKIIGNPTVTPMAVPDWNQNNPLKADYIKNKPNIVDLGTFAIEYDGDTGEEIKNETQGYQDAMDSATETGVYKITWKESGDGRTSIIITVNCDVGYGRYKILQIMLTPHIMMSNHSQSDDWYGVAYTRVNEDDKWTPWEESFERSFYKTNDMGNPNEQTYPTTKAVSNFVNDKIVTNYDEWFDSARDDTDFDEKVPAMRVIYDFFEYSGYLSEGNIYGEISPEDEAHAYTDIPNAEAVKSYVNAQVNKPSETELPAVLEPNTDYNLGMTTDAVIIFPEEANDGDVIYVVFTAGTPTDNVLIVINIDFTSGLGDFEPEPGKKYEIYGRYDARDAIWLCGYSEY